MAFHKLKYIGTKTLKKLKKQNIHQHIPGIKKILLKKINGSCYEHDVHVETTTYSKVYVGIRFGG